MLFPTLILFMQIIAIVQCAENSNQLRHFLDRQFVERSLQQENQLDKNEFLTAADPTPEPTAEPTAEVTLSPTRSPTLAPTTLPNVATSAYPTAEQATSVIFSARQIVTGISISQYSDNQIVNELTLKTAVAECMDGVILKNFKKWQASAGAGRRLEGVSLRSMQDSSSIELVYTIRVMSKLTASQLFSQLSTNVASGKFNDLLRQAALDNNADVLLVAESDSVEEIENDEEVDNSLSNLAVTGIVIGAVLVVFVLIIFLYVCIASVSRLGGSHKHKVVPSE